MWSDFGEGPMYPNIFVFLVGPPGVGKSRAMSQLAAIVRKSGAVSLAPNDVSKQSLLDALGATTKVVTIEGRPMDYHYLAIRIPELANFMSKYDAELAGALTNLYDCEDVNEELKRTHDKGKAINFPGVSMLVGTATQNLGNTIREDLWGSGFMARVILVFSAQKIIPKMFVKQTIDIKMRDLLVERFAALKDLKGELTWTPEAQDLIYDFRCNAEEEAPLHNRLAHYTTRRWMHLAKLCMIAAVNEQSMTVTGDHFVTALSWLLSAEANMTEVFKDMVSHEDGHLHEQIRAEMFQIFLKTRTPVTQQNMYEWCKGKMASHSVDRFIAIAVASGAFTLIREAGAAEDDFGYRPNPPRGFKDKGFL